MKSKDELIPLYDENGAGRAGDDEEVGDEVDDEAGTRPKRTTRKSIKQHLFEFIGMSICIGIPIMLVDWISDSIPFLRSPAKYCNPSNLAIPSLSGAEVISVSAVKVHDYSWASLGIDQSEISKDLAKKEFCNVTVAYKHIGRDETIKVQVWLPFRGWNRRFQGTGGSGWQTGHFDSWALGSAVAQGYSAAATDGGHDAPLGAVSDPAVWAMPKPGKIDMHMFGDFASVALNDLAIIGKQVTKSFYGRAPKRSYWFGCSTGGRQGHMLAQRYPEAFDGIATSAPAIFWPSFMAALYWPQLIMNQMGQYPQPCELSALTDAGIKACDGDDGVVDGILSAPDKCQFDPFSMVGTQFYCKETKTTSIISEAAAAVAAATWNGPISTTNTSLWPGMNIGTPFSVTANTTCDYSSSPPVCTGDPSLVTTQWLKVFLLKDPSYDLTSLTISNFTDLFHQANAEFNEMIATANPDLAAFATHGSKMLTWHGLSDEVITPYGTRQYYQAVESTDPNVRDYYRYFEAPGVQHCSGGPGAYPESSLQKSALLDAVVDWVEKGIVPESLQAISRQMGEDGKPAWERPLCPYPLVARYVGGGNPRLAESFECHNGF